MTVSHLSTFGDLWRDQLWREWLGEECGKRMSGVWYGPMWFDPHGYLHTGQRRTAAAEWPAQRHTGALTTAV